MRANKWIDHARRELILPQNHRLSEPGFSVAWDHVYKHKPFASDDCEDDKMNQFKALAPREVVYFVFDATPRSGIMTPLLRQTGS